MPMLARSLFALALLASASGCDTDAARACTAIGCDDALIVVVAGPDGTPAPGRYTVSVSSNLADEEPSECAFTVTASGAVESECAAFERQDEAGGVSVLFPPLAGSVTIDVERDGTLVLRRGVEPVYVGQFPNGPDCGEVCQTATARVEID